MAWSSRQISAFLKCRTHVRANSPRRVFSTFHRLNVKEPSLTVYLKSTLSFNITV